jgi:glycosyltransferase involved in cell wall biosynthesis
MRRVLFVAYNYPPHGGAGVQRSLKFSKYLPKYGWQPIVLTTTVDANPIQDYSLLSDIPDNTKIYRIPGFSIARLQSKAKKYKLDRFVVFLNLILQIPDAYRFWAKNAFSASSKILSKDKPEVIYTTSGPYSTHFVGLQLKNKYHIPWLADFRDPWNTNLITPYLPGYRTLNKILERKVINNADRVVCVSEPWLENIKSNSRKNLNKFILIENGYDEDDIKLSSFPNYSDKFTITHIGSFYRNRKPIEFIKAVENLIGSNLIPIDEFRIIFIGKNIKGLIPKYAPFESYQYVAHKYLLKFRIQTTLFLLILNTSPENKGNYSGKIYEYIAANRPILGIVPKGGVAEDLIQKTNTGICVNGNSDEIAKAILILYQKWKRHSWDWRPKRQIIQQFTRRKMTAKLAHELNIIAK